MIDRNRIPGQLCEEFSVLGSTGNVGCFRKSDVENGLLTPFNYRCILLPLIINLVATVRYTHLVSTLLD